MQEMTGLKDTLEEFSRLAGRLEDVSVLWELALEENDVSLEQEVKQELSAVEEAMEAMELQLLLDEPYDLNNAFLSLNAGAGGTEAQDWVDMLFRMYSRWAEHHGMKVEVLDMLPGEEAGTKNVTAIIRGNYAYGYLKAEQGVHRLVRISPFDSSGRRHTSFASVEVTPEVEEDNTVVINPNDLRIDTYRSGGAGGQHVNKTDSAVRITHLPTGIVVQCQNERSQHANREAAMKILTSRLVEQQLREKEQELAAQRGEQAEIGWGSQIRSYVFQPYTMVKDHRTNCEIGNIESVMNGNIDSFIKAYLRHIKSR
jgi:peptide chain release factor 2